MSTIDELLPKEPVNILVEGDSGSGKTRLIGTLARHGFEVGLIDCDKGWSILADPEVVPPDKRHLISVNIFDAVGDADAVDKIRKLLLTWPENGWGNIKTWPSKRVLVIDSLSFLTVAFQTYLLKKHGVSPEDFTSAKGLSNDDLSNVYGGIAYSVRRLVSACCHAPCSFIATGHIRYFMNKQGETLKTGFATEGSKLVAELPKAFNNVWFLEFPLNAKFPTLYTQTKAGSKIQCKSENGTVIPPKIENPDLGELLLKLRNFQ
jgi:hypothetical protein